MKRASYTANSLNQYRSRKVAAYLNVLGIANANASVTVNSQSPYRKGEYFWKELSANNASAALWQSVTNIASLTGTNQTNTGNLFLPKTAESYTYDLDGNLTSDGRWTNQWDAENRLVDMTSDSSGPSDSRKSLQFAYDSQGRRYSKVVSNWTGSAWTRVLHEKFVYDGWNLLGAIDGTNNAIIRSLLWGLDLSGSLQGAGGVGGLITFRQHSGSLAGSHFAAYDGNGNVMALVDGKTGSTSARYEYDPFGQTIRASGTMATVNPVRFSSKVVDDETDYAYYGYRYLNPNTGRWLSRDLIADKRTISVYAACRNAMPSMFDWLGLSSYFYWTEHGTPRYESPPGLEHADGATWLTSWDVTLVEKPCDACHVKLEGTGLGGAEYWYYPSEWDDDPEMTSLHIAKNHEEHHVKLFRDNWYELESEAKAYLDTCYSEAKASCLRGAINTMVDMYNHKAWRDNWQFHCDLYTMTYGQMHEDCNRALTEEGLYQSLRGEVDRAVERCNGL